MKRDLLVVAIPALGMAAYLVSEIGSQSAEGWFAGLIGFIVTFALGSLYWRRIKHRAGTLQDTLDLLPRSKGIKK